MALATLENVTATVGDHAHTVSLGVEEDGLVVGSYGKLPWAGSEFDADATTDGCLIRLTATLGGTTSYFVPASSFSSFGGARGMRVFVQWLARAAASAGARVVTPAA